MTFTLNNMYVTYPIGLDSADAAREKLWDIVVHPAEPPDTPQMTERKVRNDSSRTVEVTVELQPGESKLVQISQACGWIISDWKSKVSADIEEQ